MGTCQLSDLSGGVRFCGPFTSTREKLHRLPLVRFTQHSSQHHANTSFTLPVVAFGASSFMRGRTHTGPVILSPVTRTTRYVVNPRKNTRLFCSDFNVNAVCFNVREERPHAPVCTQLPHCRRRHSTGGEGNKKIFFFKKVCCTYNEPLSVA